MRQNLKSHLRAEAAKKTNQPQMNADNADQPSSSYEVCLLFRFDPCHPRKSVAGLRFSFFHSYCRGWDLTFVLPAGRGSVVLWFAVHWERGDESAAGCVRVLQFKAAKVGLSGPFGNG